MIILLMLGIWLKVRSLFQFRKRSSTSHALLSIVDEILSSTCGVYVDLEKAFETVNHMILLSQLSHFGIRGLLIIGSRLIYMKDNNKLH